MRSPLIVTLLAWPVLALAAEGMWTMDNLPLKKMQAEYQFTPSQSWIEHVTRASARIAGSCSASFISKDGLVMTNHHCASHCVAQLSTAQKDFIKEGFIAARREQEVACPEIELNRLENISDVTEQINQATKGRDGAAFKQAQDAIKTKLTADCVGQDKQATRCDIVDLYRGGQYHLYRYHRYTDTRLVWAPEKASAFFGGDPENFNFPRYDLDITMLRAYEGGKPAVIKDYFPFKPAGAQAGELVMVTGQPKATQRLLTVAQLESMRDRELVNELLRLAELRGILTQYGKQSAEAARVADEDLFGVENQYKSTRGRLTALTDPALMHSKLQQETALRQFVANQPDLKSPVGGAWDAIGKAQQDYQALDESYNQLEAAQAFHTHYFSHARTLVRAAIERSLPNEQRLPEYSDTKLSAIEHELFSTAPLYPDFEQAKLSWSLSKMREALGATDPSVKLVFGKQSADQLSKGLIQGSKLNDVAVRKALWQGGLAALQRSDDAMIKLALAIDPAARAIRKQAEAVNAVIQKNAELVARARFAYLGDSIYPDATATLRLSYGEVQGWQEPGRTIDPFTNIGGAYQLDSGAEPYALPASWLRAKDRVNLKQRFNFVTSNDIVGGNSGSPMINRDGQIVGLVFDSNIHGLGGKFWFDPKLNRTVAVHSGAILETLSTIYGGDNLVREMTH